MTSTWCCAPSAPLAERGASLLQRAGQLTDQLRERETGKVDLPRPREAKQQVERTAEPGELEVRGIPLPFPTEDGLRRDGARIHRAISPPAVPAARNATSASVARDNGLPPSASPPR
jgi:hypothetical protein